MGINLTRFFSINFDKPKRGKKSIKFMYMLGINIIMMWLDIWDKLKTNRIDLESKLYFFSARRAALPDNPRK